MVPFRHLLAVARLAGFVLAGLVLAGLVQAGPAAAAEWTLAADVAQRVEVDSNFKLDDESEGVLYGATSTIDLRLAARTKRTRWNLATGTRLSVFAGSGDDTGLDGADPRASGGVFHRGKRFTANLAFGFSRQSVASTQFGLAALPAGSVILPGGTVILPDGTLATLDDFGTISNEDATRTSLNLRGGVTLNLDALNRLSLSASGTLERFSNEDGGELEPSNSYGTTVSWEHDLTKRTSTDLSLGLRRFTVDDAENFESLTLTTTGGLDTQLTPRLTFGFDAGFNVANIKRDPPGRDDTPVGFNGGLRLDGQLAADTQFSLEANQGFEPSSLGELQTRSTVGLSIEHSINSRARLSLSASYSRQVSAGTSNDTDNSQLFVLSPSYTIDLSPDWQVRMGYTFRLRDEDAGLATSNNFFVSINRSFDLLR